MCQPYVRRVSHDMCFYRIVSMEVQHLLVGETSSMIGGFEIKRVRSSNVMDETPQRIL